jgi:hypothetical protein
MVSGSQHIAGSATDARHSPGAARCAAGPHCAAARIAAWLRRRRCRRPVPVAHFFHPIFSIAGSKQERRREPGQGRAILARRVSEQSPLTRLPRSVHSPAKNGTAACRRRPVLLAPVSSPRLSAGTPFPRRSFVFSVFTTERPTAPSAFTRGGSMPRTLPLTRTASTC